ncbi:MULTISPECIES: hypothetical protein [unclassified Synechococcus]|nr:hypothetical protein [Synechococcus sp. MIT S9220]
MMRATRSILIGVRPLLLQELSSPAVQRSPTNSKRFRISGAR